MNVLVTGASGQLGQSIQAIAGEFLEINFYFVNQSQLDISSEIEVIECFQKQKFDFVINCAAFTAVDLAENTPEKAFLINAESVKNLAQACLQHNTVLIHISTDYLFDGKKGSPYFETDSPNPLNIYGKSKLAGEEHIQKIHSKYFIIRTSWLYSEFGNNFLKTILRLAKTQNEITVINDQIGTPTYAGDLARFIVLLILKNNHKYGIYNYSNQGAISWLDFALAIINLTNNKTTILPTCTSKFVTKAKRPSYSVLSKVKTISTFNLDIPNWEESLKFMLKRFVHFD